MEELPLGESLRGMLSNLLSKKGSLCYLASALQYTGSWCLLSDVSLREGWSCLRDLQPNCASEIGGVGVSSLSCDTDKLLGMIYVLQ